MATTLQCSELTPPAKGSMTGSNSYRDVVYFRCAPGYQLVGDSPLTCQSDGTWSGTSPTCIKVCPVIRPPANGGHNGSVQVLRFFCEEGYTLVGASLLTCRPDGTWTGNPPTCRDCYVGNGATYRGQVNITDVGLVCQRWEDQTPHSHHFLDLSIGGLSENYCRNPDSEKRPWCYTLDPSVRWQYCPVKSCGKCTNGYQLLAQTCIKVYSYEKDYGEALAVCEKDGAILAMPKTRELDVALRNLIRKVGVDFEYWIGLVFCEHWRWADGSRISKYKYKGWNPNKPDTGWSWALENSKKPYCGQYWSGRTGTPMWDDTICCHKKRFICQATQSHFPQKSSGWLFGKSCRRCPKL
ncbi:uncharacterized protein LOC144927235 [Branchiostoma floridae x Branchiostoma belcheri]